MRSKKRTRKDFAVISIISLLLISIVAFVGFNLYSQTTIYNRTVEPVVWEIYIFSHNGTDISDTFDDAVISDTITFEVEFIEEGDRIHHVTMNVTGTSEGASPGGSWYFEQSILFPSFWAITFDTTQLLNGEYDFDFYYVEEQPSIEYGGDPLIDTVAFSSFLLSMEDGFGTLTVEQVSILIWIGIFAAVIIGGTSVIWFLFPRSKSKRKSGML